MRDPVVPPPTKSTSETGDQVLAMVRIQGLIVSGNYFTALRVKPVLGRGFLPEEDKTAHTHPVVVISYGLWQRRFGDDPGIVGKPLSLNSNTFTVVGIAPSEFNGTIAGGAPDVYVPLMMIGQVSSTTLSDRRTRSMV
jgi:hypothetical protein